MLLRNLGGDTPKFVSTEYVSGADRIEDSRGIGVVDIDLDGDLDLVVQGLEKPTVLLVNEGPAGNWLEVRLTGTRCNRDAIGASIEARVGERVFRREVSGSHALLTGKSLMSHFGLGDAEAIDELTVHWPGGGVTRMKDVEVNQMLRIVQAGEADAGGVGE